MRPFLILLSASLASASEPAVTVYNGGFAVVRDRIEVTLGSGPGRISYPGASAHVEPGTALIAVPAGIRVLEHTYRNDPVSTTRLLQLFEGQTIDIEAIIDGKREIRKARIVRAPVSVHQEAWQRFGRAYAQRQQTMLGWGGAMGGNEVLLDIDGQLRFGLPGTPLFPSLPASTDLRPTLEWQVVTTAPVNGPAEISYLCDGMRWDAAYTLVSAEGDEGHVDLNGMMSVENQSGTDYLGARLKVVAGDVAKLDEQGNDLRRDMDSRFRGSDMMKEAVAAIEARAEGKAFSDYHLYTLPDPVDLRDRETKQLGFLDVRGITSQKRLVYDGLDMNWNMYRGWDPLNFRTNRDFGTTWNPKVAIERVIANEAANRLGKPLPAGVVRCYLKDRDGRPEFIGENHIDHTPEGEPLRIRTGNAFDVVGERIQTDFRYESDKRFVEESYRITLRNHRAEPTEVTIVEHFYRAATWTIPTSTVPFTKRDSRTIDLPVTVPGKGETTVTYQVRYTW